MTKKDAKEMGKRIQQHRRAAKLTQAQLAETIDISANYLSNIETGRDICSSEVLLAIANLLHLSMDYLLGNSLLYNRVNPSDFNDAHTRLLHKLPALTDAQCEHLCAYIELLERQNHPEE